MPWMMSPPQFPSRYFFYLFGRCFSLKPGLLQPILGLWGGKWLENPPKFDDFRTKFPWRILPYFPMFFPHVSHGISQATFDDTGVGRHLLHHYDGCSPQVPVHHGPRYRPLAWRCDQAETTKTHQTGIQPAKIGLKQPFHADLLGI